MTSPAPMNTVVTRVENPQLPGGTGNASVVPFYGTDGGEARSGTPNLKFWSTVRKYWWVALLVWAVVSAPLIIYIKAMPQKYKATGALDIKPTISNPLSNPGGNSDVVPAFFHEYVATQVQLMESPKVLRTAASDPRMQNYDWFVKLPDQVNYLETVLDIGQWQQASELVPISVTHTDPRAAADIVNCVVEAYVRNATTEIDRDINQRLQTVNDLCVRTQQDLDTKQAGLNKINNSDIGPLEEQRKMVLDQLGGARSKLEDAQSQHVGLLANLSNLKATPETDPAVFVKQINYDTDPLISTWEAQKIKLQASLIELQKKYNVTTSHPDYVQMNQQLTAIDKKLSDRKEQIRKDSLQQMQAHQQLDNTTKQVAYNADLRSNEQTIADLQARTVRLEKEASQLTEKIQPVVTLREQIELLKDDLKRYQGTKSELEALVKAPGRVTVAFAADVPLTPVDSKKVKLAGAGVGGGFFAAIATLFLIARLRNRIEHADDLPENMRGLVVGTVSNAATSARGLQGKMGRKILGEEMRLVHANLLPPGTPSRRVIMVTSPTPGNGKTSIASHLALSLAKSELNVLLIDGDMRKRDLSVMFDTGLKPGLAELLQCQPTELLKPVELLPNFFVMGAGGKLTRNPAELFQKKHLRDVIDAMEQKFDVIVIDTPPTLVVADSRLIAASCDEVICVVRAQVSSSKDVNQTVDALTRVTGEAPKIILNGVQHQGQYYKHKYSYTAGESGTASNGSKTDRVVTLADMHE